MVSSQIAGLSASRVTKVCRVIQPKLNPRLVACRLESGLRTRRTHRQVPLNVIDMWMRWFPATATRWNGKTKSPRALSGKRESQRVSTAHARRISGTIRPLLASVFCAPHGPFPFNDRSTLPIQPKIRTSKRPCFRQPQSCIKTQDEKGVQRQRAAFRDCFDKASLIFSA